MQHYRIFSNDPFNCSACDRVYGLLSAQVTLIQAVFVCQGLS